MFIQTRFEPTRHHMRAVAATAVALLATACGGGGGSSDATPAAPDNAIPSQATALLVASQASADALARDAEQRTRDMRLASGLAGSLAPGATPSGATVGSLLTRRRALAASDFTSELCSAGSATLDVSDALLARFQSNPNATLQAGDSIAFTTRNCVVKAPVDLGDVAIGNFGVGATINGNFTLVLQQRSGNDYLFSLTYAGFSYAPAGSTAFDPLDAVLQFGSTAGQPVFALDLGAARVLAAPSVATAGAVTSVNSGAIRARAAAAAGGGWADYSFQSWVYDGTALRATAGSVVVSGTGETRALITATASGYSVDVSAGGSTTRFSVGR